MTNYVQHFQNIFVWGRETWQFCFCKVQHSPRPWWDCQSSSALLWGLEKAPVLQCHHPLESLSSLLKLGSFCVSSLNLSVFLFHKMVADENKLHHPYLQLPLFLRALESVFRLTIMMLRAAWCLMSVYFLFCSLFLMSRCCLLQLCLEGLVMMEVPFA